MSIFEVEYSNERILPNSGLAIVGAILEQGGFREKMNRLDVTGRRSGHQIKDGDLMSTYIALCCMGKPEWTATRSFMSFVWAWSVCLRKLRCASGWIR